MQAGVEIAAPIVARSRRRRRSLGRWGQLLPFEPLAGTSAALASQPSDLRPQPLELLLVLGAPAAVRLPHRVCRLVAAVI
eukprot:4568753-Prymnesium_polylepis.2